MNKFRLDYVLIVLVLFTSCSKEEIADYQPIVDNSINIDILAPNINYMENSYITDIPFPESAFNYRGFNDWHPPLEAVNVDYNKDGYLDIIETNSNYGTNVVNKVQFWEGQPDGTYKYNLELSSKFTGLYHGRKGIVGDYNNDGWPDIFFIGHGYDLPPFPGEHPILLTNLGGKDFTITRFTDLESFYHTGASADIDYDGDLDIVLISLHNEPVDSKVFENDGQGNFTITSLMDNTIINWNTLDPYLGGKFTLEILDQDNDGYLDIVLAGREDQAWNTPNIIIKGSSSGYNTAIELPIITDYQQAVDIDFIDLNNDGKNEIFLNKTAQEPFYQGYYVQVIDGNTYEDVTANYFNIQAKDNTSNTDVWLYWLAIYEQNNGDIILRSDDLKQQHKWVLRAGENYFQKVR